MQNTKYMVAGIRGTNICHLQTSLRHYCHGPHRGKNCYCLLSTHQSLQKSSGKGNVSSGGDRAAMTEEVAIIERATQKSIW